MKLSKDESVGSFFTKIKQVRSKAYRVYIPGQRHIEVSKDVIFHEEAVFRKTLELSSEDIVAPLEFPDLEIQREEEEFDRPT